MSSEACLQGSLTACSYEPDYSYSTTLQCAVLDMQVCYVLGIL